MKSIRQETEVRWESDGHPRALGRENRQKLGCAQEAQKGDLLGLGPWRQPGMMLLSLSTPRARR